MHCPVCGNTMFSVIDNKWEHASPEVIPGDAEYKCSDCGMVISKDKLLAANQSVIDANIEDIKDEALKEIEKKLKKLFR